MSDSLRPYLKFHNLFVRELNREASLAVVKSFLEKLCPNGKVTIRDSNNKSHSVHND
jgi:imidazoleglycerol phosphate dehydratase HisB